MSKSKRGRRQAQTLTEQPNISFWLIIALVAGFLFIAPFYRGVFNGGNFIFDGPLYGSLVVGALILALLPLFLYRTWQDHDNRNILALIVWLIPLSYVISYFFAASAHSSYNAILINIMYATFFVAGLYLSRAKIGMTILKWTLFVSSYTVVLFGFMNLFGRLEWFTYEHSVMYTNVGLRLTSVFQYANTYSAFLMAILFATLIWLATSRRWVVIALSSFMLVPIIVSFALTLSRGGLLILPIVFIIVLPFLSLPRQILIAIHFAIAGAASLIISEAITDIGFQLSDPEATNAYGKGFAILFGTSAIVSLISVTIQRYISQPFTDKIQRLIKLRFAPFIVPVLFIMLAAFAIYSLFSHSAILNVLPDNLRERVENINFEQHSVLERQTFYSNAIDMFKDRPVFGAGGDAWAAMYQAYQTNPYTSSQAHSFYFKYLVETGLFGFLILAAFLIIILYLFIKEYIRERSVDKLIFFIYAIAILIHSAIDFNMSYIYITSTVFLYLGIASSTLHLHKQNSPSVEHVMASSKATEKASNRSSKATGKSSMVSNHVTTNVLMSRITSARWVNVYPLILVMIALFTLFGSIRLVQANTAFKEVLELNKGESIPFYDVKNKLDSAIQKSRSPEFLNYKISMLTQAHTQSNEQEFLDEAIETLELLDQREPYNRLKIENAINVYTMSTQAELILESLEQGISNFSWDISMYDRAIALYYSLGMAASADSGDQYIYNEHWDRAVELYEIVQSKTEELALLPEAQLQGRSFDLSAQSIQAIEQIKASNSDENN